MFIKSKWIKYYAKRTIKFTSLFAVGLIIMASIIYIKYKPSYKVTLNGQTIGYVQDKEEMQKMIEDLKIILEKMLQILSLILYQVIS